MSNLPNVFIIGLAKAGTTAIADFLRERSEVYVPLCKEPRFLIAECIKSYNAADPLLSGIMESSVLELPDYQELFNQLEPIRIDASVHYFMELDTFISNVKKLGIVDPKIILVLRDPIDRAMSNASYNFHEELDMCKELRKSYTYEEKGWNPFWHYLQQSFFTRKLEVLRETEWDVLILNYENLRSNPRSVVKDLYEFLSLEDDGRDRIGESNVHVIPMWRILNVGRVIFRKLLPARWKSGLKKKLFRKPLYDKESVRKEFEELYKDERKIDSFC